MDFPDNLGEIKVRIVEAHNVYINYTGYQEPKKEDSSSDDENHEVNQRTRSKKHGVMNASVQTEPAEINSEREKYNNQKTSLNDKTNSTIVKTPLEESVEVGTGDSKNTQSSNNSEDFPSDMDTLAQKFQYLSSNFSDNSSCSDKGTPDNNQKENASVNDVSKVSTHTQTGHNSSSTVLSPSTEPTSRQPNSERETASYEEGSYCDSSLDKKTLTSLDCFSSMIEKFIPRRRETKNFSNDDLIKIIIIHCEADVDLVKQIVSRLRRNPKFWAIASFELEPLMHVSPIDNRKAAVDWADILVPLISDQWLSEINNLSTTASLSSLNARYTFQLLQTNYISSACTNFKIISAVREGTSVAFRKRPEIKDAILVMRNYNELERMIIDFHNLTKLLRSSNRFS